MAMDLQFQDIKFSVLIPAWKSKFLDECRKQQGGTFTWENVNNMEIGAQVGGFSSRLFCGLHEKKLPLHQLN